MLRAETLCSLRVWVCQAILLFLSPIPASFAALFHPSLSLSLCIFLLRSQRRRSAPFNHNSGGVQPPPPPSPPDLNLKDFGGVSKYRFTKFRNVATVVPRPFLHTCECRITDAVLSVSPPPPLPLRNQRRASKNKRALVLTPFFLFTSSKIHKEIKELQYRQTLLFSFPASPESSERHRRAAGVILKYLSGLNGDLYSTLKREKGPSLFREVSPPPPCLGRSCFHCS